MQRDHPTQAELRQKYPDKNHIVYNEITVYAGFVESRKVRKESVKKILDQLTAEESVEDQPCEIDDNKPEHYDVQDEKKALITGAQLGNIYFH